MSYLKCRKGRGIWSDSVSDVLTLAYVHANMNVTARCANSTAPFGGLIAGEDRGASSLALCEGQCSISLIANILFAHTNP